ncbi:mfs multidrug protein [Apiospora kogelbergensis]|uniref:Mfs multidrug protein n=1 Tax=Apiospora kogelbergensis TaxID=1337665 RepID=A0AAW0QQE6_9PEZI
MTPDFGISDTRKKQANSTDDASVSSSLPSIAAAPSRIPTTSRFVTASRTDGTSKSATAAPLDEKTSTTAPNPGDPDLVTWEGPEDPANPKTWSFFKKWRAMFIVSCFTLMSPLSSSLVAPSLGVIGADLDVPPGTEQALVLSIFILAYAIGPLLWGPLSELYGRIVVLQLTNLLYLGFNLGCGLAKTKTQLIVFRFLAGLGGSAPLAIGGGVLADLFTAEERGKAISLYSLAPLLGPAIGPIAGAFITENTTWRWSFWATTIADAVIQLLGLVFLRETYAPVLLGWKRERLSKSTGNQNLHTPYDDPDRTVARTLRTAMARPFRLLATQIIVQVLSLYMLYLGLNYISLGLGFFLGSQACAFMQNRIYASLKRRHGGASKPGRPEYRVPMMAPGAVLVPLGLFIYGWTAEYRTHWIGPNVGACVFAAGAVIGFQCVQTYLVDTYTRYAASAVGAATVMRSLAGFGFPLFAASLYDRLGLGWGNSLLAFVGIVIGWPSPVLLWYYGEALRERSPFAAGGR